MEEQSHKEKWLASMIAKHGSEEAVREFMAASAKKIKDKSRGGFASMDKDKHLEASHKGGKMKGMRGYETDEAPGEDAIEIEDPAQGKETDSQNR